MTMMVFPPYEPDRSIHNTGATDSVLNVKPVADSWGPMYALSPFSAVLPSPPRGGIALRSASGAQVAFVGTATGLYSLAPDGSWTDVSGASAPYAMPVGDNWTFEIFGERVIATQIGNFPQYYDIGVSTDFATLPNAPKAKFVSVVGDFIWLLNLEGNPAGYAFSGLNNSEQWTPGLEFSDTGAFPDGGEIMGCVPTVGGCFILQRTIIRVATFAPQSGYTFTITTANEKKGCVAPYSISKIGPGDFVFLAQDGFCRGAAATPIGFEKVDGTFKKTVSPDQIELVTSTTDPDEGLIYFRYQQVDGTSIFLIYDWQQDRWSRSNQNVSALLTMVTTSYRLEDLDALFPGGPDTVTFSVDTLQFSGRRPAIAGFTSDYRVGFFSGLTLAAQIETGTGELNPPERSFVRGAQVVGDIQAAVDGSYDYIETSGDDLEGSPDDYTIPGFTITLATADFHGPDLVWGSPSRAHTKTGIVPFRSSGRLHRARLNINAGVSWNHAVGIRFDAIGEGNR